MAELVLKGASVLDASGRRPADVVVRDGRIAAVGPDLHAGHVLDATGCVITPGFVDLNAGVGQPGNEETETVHTAARAAALGGYTTIVARSDTDPVIDSAALVREMLARGVGACCRVLPSATVTVGRRRAAQPDGGTGCARGTALQRRWGGCGRRTPAASGAGVRRRARRGHRPALRGGARWRPAGT